MTINYPCPKCERINVFSILDVHFEPTGPDTGIAHVGGVLPCQGCGYLRTVGATLHLRIEIEEGDEGGGR